MRSLRAVETGSGGGRRKGERFKPAAEMGEDGGAEANCKAEVGRELGKDHHIWRTREAPTSRAWG